MMLLSMIENDSVRVILSLAIMVSAGLIFTAVTRRIHLPDVTGYILAGVAIGPYALHLIPDGIADHMGFVADVALAFIAFGVGRYFKWSVLKKNGKKVVIITAMEALMAGLVITLAMLYIFHLSLPFSLLLGAIGSATAPASTIMTIRQYKAKGEFVNTILQVVALDDAVALLAFSACTAVVSASEGNGAGVWFVLKPILLNIGALALGAFFGLVLHWLVDREKNRERRIILLIGLVLILTGFCSSFDISPLLSCMVMGTVYINVGGSKKTFTQLNHFTPAVFLLFFVNSGMRLNVPMLKTAGIIGVSYFFIRIVGKYIGAYLGARFTGAAAEIRRYLGLALIPQAGVSIGLSVLAERMLPEKLGMLLSTIILSSSILYELTGPACAKASLFLAGAIPGRRKGTGRETLPDTEGKKTEEK
ncbi:cation:proton antiporter [Qiania dongpingensis]|uniref:Cation:proton antiporter n=1 Tax=Qiania dongpingensis TaxID=2763669 RepID=A0A7G9G5D9_9FIRM|nr:cation:proton antiporter [Qiania dongpingensis]QNM06021.1 cation:proton antiporter [Qiania dongpingensis]